MVLKTVLSYYDLQGQFNSVTIAMTNITNILLDFINGVQVSRSEILPRIVSLMVCIPDSYYHYVTDK